MSLLGVASLRSVDADDLYRFSAYMASKRSQAAPGGSAGDLPRSHVSDELSDNAKDSGTDTHGP